MPLVSASAPMPSPAPTVNAFVKVSNRKSASQRRLRKSEREVLSDLASLLRNVRFDLSQPKRVDGRSIITKKYVQEIGMRVLQVVHGNFDMLPRDIDAMLDRLK